MANKPTSCLCGGTTRLKTNTEDPSVECWKCGLQMNSGDHSQESAVLRWNHLQGLLRHAKWCGTW